MLISVNDYGDMSAASAAMTAAFDEGVVDRLVLDVRYLRGGNGDIKILEVIAADARINRRSVLTALIGRENVSAGTQVASFLDKETAAILVGEPTPARADNFLCDCATVTLNHSGCVIELPRYWARSGDARDAVTPDIPMSLSSEDFFAGRDPVLDAAMKGFGPL
jgi:C-terminal processing protease CtpA/Prc